MRLRTHILASALLGAALYPRAPRKAALLLAGGVLLDADHYVLYALRSGDWSPSGALHYDTWRNQPIALGDARRRYGSLRSIFHSARFTIPLVWLLGLRWPELRPPTGQEIKGTTVVGMTIAEAERAVGRRTGAFIPRDEHCPALLVRL